MASDRLAVACAKAHKGGDANAKVAPCEAPRGVCRGAVDFGSLEKKRLASAASTVRGSAHKGRDANAKVVPCEAPRGVCRGAVAFGSLEKKRRALAASTVRGSPGHA